MNLYELKLAAQTKDDMIAAISRYSSLDRAFDDALETGKDVYYVLAETAGEAERKVVEAHAAAGHRSRIVVGSVNILAATGSVADGVPTILLT